MKKAICVIGLVVFSPVLIPAAAVGLIIGLIAGAGAIGVGGSMGALSRAIDEVFE